MSNKTLVNFKVREEKRVFRELARAASIPIVQRSLEKAVPPHPDLICRTVEGSRFAVEVTELKSAALMARVDRDHRLKGEIEQGLTELTSTERRLFKRKYDDALLYFDFDEQSSLRARRKTIVPALSELLKLRDSCSGDQLAGKIGRGDVLRYVEVIRDVPNGPNFFCSTAHVVIDPTKRILETKFSKQYQSDHPIYLLAYFSIHPWLRHGEWVDEIASFIRGRIRASPFSSVFIFDRAKQTLALRVDR